MPKKRATRPARIFIGSSTPALEYAEGLRSALQGRDSSLEIRTWKDDVIKPPGLTLDELTELATRYDFAAFIFAADEEMVSPAGGTDYITRDNVIYEAGLFTAALGRDRVFIVPEALTPPEQLRVLSDLSGITHTATFRQPSDDNYTAQMQLAAQGIAHAVRRLKQRPDACIGAVPFLSLAWSEWMDGPPHHLDTLTLGGGLVRANEVTVMITVDIPAEGHGMRSSFNRYLWTVSEPGNEITNGFGLYHVGTEMASSHVWAFDATAGKGGSKRWARPEPPNCPDTLKPGPHHFAVSWSRDEQSTEMWIDGGANGHALGSLRSDGKELWPDVGDAQLTIGRFNNDNPDHHIETRFRSFHTFHRLLTDDEIRDWARFSVR